MQHTAATSGVAPPLALLKEAADRAAGRPRPDADADHGGRGGRRIVCRACGHAVTTSGARIEVGGAHRHAFFNPHGLVFHIGCFCAAPGCAPAGPPSTEFAWFPGHAWQVALCRGCAAHLGWRFTGPDGAFHGLILDHLAEREDSAH